MLILLFPLLALAFDMAPMQPPSQQKTFLRYTGLYQAKAPASNGQKLATDQHSLLTSLPIPLSKKAGLTLSGRAQRYNAKPNSAVLPDLHEFQLGLTYARELAPRKLWTLGSTFGSASDKPFKDASVNVVTATATYSYPTSEMSSWTFLLNYSNNRTFLNNIPLLGFAYTYAPSRALRTTFGLPFASIYWRFADRWSLLLFYLVPRVAKAQIGYSIAGPVEAFAGIDFSQSTYRLYGRQNHKERFFHDEKKAFLGLKSPLSRHFFAEIQGGYAFSRRFFTAERYTTTPSSTFRLASQWYGQTTLSAQF